MPSKQPAGRECGKEGPRYRLSFFFFWLLRITKKTHQLTGTVHQIIKFRRKPLFNTLNKKNITAFGFEFIKDKQEKLPFVRIMSEIAGNTAMLIAGEYLSTVNKGKGLMLGGISGLMPTSVVVIGAGTVGEYACRTSLGLGASVIVFDDSVTKLRRLQNNLSSGLYPAVRKIALFKKVKSFQKNLCLKK